MLGRQGTIKSLLCLGIAGVLLVAGTWMGLFAHRREYTGALSMQAMLINVSIAQEAYYHTHQHFTTQWADILPMVAKPASLQLRLRAVPDQPDTYLMEFGKAALLRPVTYEVVLSVAGQGTSGQLTARRTGSKWFSYQLVRSVPQGQTQCFSGWMGKYFCRRILEKSEQLELKNLIPVSSAS